ncbi:MAG TPA: hypothetical protein VL155_18350 [Terriglobales bacterium]|nr:hypothetical protein [Terriglobales bacterium]
MSRLRHFCSISQLGWAGVALVWSAFWALDSSIEKWGTPDLKSSWNSYTGHLRFGSWQVWLIGVLLIALIMLFEGSYRHHRETTYIYESAERKAAQELGALREKIKELELKAGQPTDPTLMLLRERQRLEAELEPLLRIEEAGIKVIPTVKIGKDESDYRKEEIARLRRDIGTINAQLEPRTVPASNRDWPREWKELAAAFREVATQRIRADWSRTSVGETWDITGGGNDASRRVQSLCKHAGDLLIASPKISHRIPNELAVQSPMDRWLFWVKAQTVAFQHTGQGIESLGNGQTSVISLGTIHDIAEISANLCLEFASEEY